MRCKSCEKKLGRGSYVSHVCPAQPTPVAPDPDVPQVTHFEAADTSPGIKRARKTVQRKTRKVEP